VAATIGRAAAGLVSPGYAIVNDRESDFRYEFCAQTRSSPARSAGA
jgi:hypothetical protein